MTNIYARAGLALGAGVLAPVLMALPALAAPPAAAAPAVGQVAAKAVVKNTDKVRITDTRYNTLLYACVKATFSSDVTYTAEHTQTGGGGLTDGWAIRKIKFTAPTTTATVYRYDSVDHACTTTKQKVKKLKVTSATAGYSCDWNPQISVGAPFAIGIGFWPSCDSHKVGLNSGSGSNTATKKLYDDDGYVKFPDQVLFTQGAAPGFRRYAVRLVTTVTKGDSDYTVRSNLKKVKLTPSY